LGNLKNSREVEAIQNFAKQFEDSVKIENFKNDLITSQTLLQMAKFYIKSGDISKAINIYFTLLDRDEFISDKKSRHELLANLGNCYLKGGFLKKSEDFFLESLRLFARNKDALISLVILYEKSNKPKKALEVIESLEQFDYDIYDAKSYLEAKLILQDKNLTKKKKIDKLFDISSSNHFVIRLYLEFMGNEPQNIDFQKVQEFDLSNSIDILWNIIDENFELKEVQNDLIKQILNAKGLKDFQIQKTIIEFDILRVLVKQSYNKVTLSFEYSCNECKNIFPIYFYRCPTCQSIASTSIQPIIIKKTDYAFNSFL